MSIAAEYLGPFYALATAASWSVAVILFKQSGREMPPVGLNVFKNLVALLLLGLTLLLVDGGGQGTARQAVGADVVALIVSGAIGIGVADSLMFRSINILGAGRAAIVDCTYSPLIVLLSFFMLGERLSLPSAVGAVLIVGAVLLITLPGPVQSLSKAEAATGIAYGVAAMSLMAVSIVAVTPILQRYDVLWSTTLRVVGGVAMLLFSLPFSRGARRSVAQALRPQRAWGVAVLGSVVGGYVALLFWVAGFKYATAGVAGILNQTSTPLTVLLAAVVLREPFDRRHLYAVALAFLGSVVVLL